MNIALVGCGDIVRRSYAPTLNMLRAEGKIQNIYCCDVDSTQAKKICKTYSFDSCFSDVETMIRNVNEGVT